MTERSFPANVMRQFVDTLSAELGHDTLSAVLSKAGLPVEWAHAAHFGALDDIRTAQAYARLQAALRTYYGRGARGILLRIGTKLWGRLLSDATFGLKTQSAVIRGLPKSLRRKPVLDLLAKLLSSSSSDITVHTQDLDLLFVDHVSPTTIDQKHEEPICYVTLGLIRESLFWATGQEHDIEEHTCRALGGSQCEFKITAGG
ncbi:MAG: 4-vinyl reductase [Anaerolineales bacterium]